MEQGARSEELISILASFALGVIDTMVTLCHLVCGEVSLYGKRNGIFSKAATN
jgi:hypothetical protein